MRRLVKIRQLALWLAAAIAVTLVLPASPDLSTTVEAQTTTTMDCTFTSNYTIVLLRDGPGRTFTRVGFLRTGDTLRVVDQAPGEDLFVWWRSDQDTWVRSDLGTSDCPATCGNTICEYGETEASCAQDCTGVTTAGASTAQLISTGVGCLAANSQQCLDSIDCYPDCSPCEVFMNTFGCVTCECGDAIGTTAAATTTTTAATATLPTATGVGCTFATCADCIAAFPCTDGPCSVTECSLNEFGCPVCETAP